MMCTECGKGRLVETILPEHIEDLGGVKVKLINSVLRYQCAECGGDEQTEIPDLRALVQAVAMARALIPIRLTGRELRFMRRALDMNQQAFAEAMELKPETVSRWEKDAQGIGGMSEKLVRHNVCALLHKQVPALDYDPGDIARMRFKAMPEGVELPPIPVTRVLVKHDHHREDAWDAEPIQMAA